MTPGGSRDYLLPAHESERIFTRQIAPSLLRAEPTGARPIAILLRGQPGAGKTVLAARLADETTGRPARVDVDMFRAFHPAYQQLRTVGDLTADALVQADARRWFEMAIEHLAGVRADILAEHVIPDDTLARLDEAGYRIGAALLAVPQAVSRLRVLERYQLAREVTGTGRYVSRQAHDRRYQDLLDVAADLDSDPQIAAADVYGRAADSRPVYRNQRQPGGEWQHPAAARAALERERSRPWTARESRNFLALHASLATRIDLALKADLDDALGLAGPFLHTPSGISLDRLTAVSFPLPLAEALRQGPAPPRARRRPTPPPSCRHDTPGR